MNYIKETEVILNGGTYSFERNEKFATDNDQPIRLFKIIKNYFDSHNLPLSNNSSRKLIIDCCVRVNGNVIYDPNHLIVKDDIIEVSFQFDKSRIYQNPHDIIDYLIQLIKSLDKDKSINSIFQEDIKKEYILYIYASLVRFCLHFKNNLYDIPFIRLLEKFFDNNSSQIYEKIGITNNKKPHEKITALITKLIDIESKLEMLIHELNNTYNLHSFQQQFRSCLNSLESQYLVKPFFPSDLINNTILDSLFKPLVEISTVKVVRDKILIYDKAKKIYNDYNVLLSKYQTEYCKRYLDLLISKLSEILYYEAYGESSGDSNISIVAIEKKYPVSSNINIELNIKLFNSGNGPGHDVSIQMQSTDFRIHDPVLKYDILPIGYHPIIIQVDSLMPWHDKKSIHFEIRWKNSDGSDGNQNQVIYFEAQKTEIPWDDLKKKRPYSLTAIQDIDKLLGRDLLVKEVIDNITTNKLESYLFYGQRRVGKSSIVKTIKNKINNDYDLLAISIYLDATLLKHTDASKTLNKLGERICENLMFELELKYNNTSKYVKNQDLSVPHFDGSLEPLFIFFKSILSFNKNLNVIIIIDEFDSMNYEVYKPSELSDTLFKNLRGLNNDFQNVSFILVGSENMLKIINWHGDTLNNWNNRKIDTFKKTSEDISSYKQIVTTPVHPWITYSSDSIEELYELSGGNPYFTNLICGWIFNYCYEKKDSEVVLNDVRKIIKQGITTEGRTSFQHFWKDGILEPIEKVDLFSDIRRRTLLAYERAAKSFYSVNKNWQVPEDEIIKNFIKPEITIAGTECKNQIKEFVSRQIFYFQNSGYRVRPLIFEEWLLCMGSNSIIEGITDLQELKSEIEHDDKLHITDDEINKIIQTYQYQDQYLTNDKIKRWFSQFESNRQRRFIYELLNNMIYVDNQSLKNSLKNIFDNAQKGIPRVLEKGKIKRDDMYIGLFNSFRADNEYFAKYFSDIIYLKKDNIKPITTLHNYIERKTRAIIILLPLLYYDYGYLSDLKLFWQRNKDFIVNHHIKLFFISLYSSKNFYKTFENEANEICERNIEFFHNDKIEHYNFVSLQADTDNQIFSKHDLHNIYRLLFPEELQVCSSMILFQLLCVQQTIPFFWYTSEDFSPLFPNPNEFDNSYYNSLKYQLNTKAQEIGNILERNMLEILSKVLAKEYDQKWFSEGVPKKIKQKCYERWDDENRKLNEWNYIDIIDYKEIINNNLKILNKYFFYIDPAPKHSIENWNKEDALNWIIKFNNIRKKYAHPSRQEPVSSDEYEYLNKLNNWFNSNKNQNKI